MKIITKSIFSIEVSQKLNTLQLKSVIGGCAPDPAAHPSGPVGNAVASGDSSDPGSSGSLSNRYNSELQVFIHD